jgi:septal ring factor EnvC (AmiA/AmiB activator)
MNLSEKVRQNFAAFLASFSSRTDALHRASPDPEQEPSETDTLNTLFEAISASYPESFANEGGFTQPQKAEALMAFFEFVTQQTHKTSTQLTEVLSELNALKADHQALLTTSAETEAAFQATQLDLEGLNNHIQELTEQLGARPSIPLNVTDPALSLFNNQEKDETGKQILSAMPKDMKRKLSAQSPAT